MLIALLGAVACGDDDSAEGGGAASGGGEGVYVWEDEQGAIVRYTIPAPAGHELVQPIERFKARSGARGEVTFVLAELDNTEGSERVQIPDLDIVTEDGDTVVFQSAWLLVGDWQDSVEIDDSAIYNEGVDVYNSLLELDDALPGAKTTTILAADSTMPSVKRVFASGGFMEPIELSKE